MESEPVVIFLDKRNLESKKIDKRQFHMIP